jgi:dipeptidyl aminopeptidase/acylaminoacyl peptidase
VQVLTEGWDASPSGWFEAPDGGSVYFHAQDKGRTNLYELGLAGKSTAPKLLVRGGNTSNVAVASSGQLFFTRDGITLPGELWTAKRDGSGARAVTRFNGDLASKLDLGSTRDVEFEGAKGDRVQMWLVFPPGYVAGRRYPLLQVIHGGPHGASLDQFHFRWNGAMLASRGFVVAMVNFHGSTGAGEAFAQSIVGAHGDLPFTDIMKSTDWLIAEGIADSTRMAASGGSYGGYLVDWILGHTNRFKALVSHAGVYDLMGQFASDATWGRSRNYGATPWEDPARIERWSPNQFAANFTTPTLVLHGEKDYRVPVTQGIQLYGVLTAKGVPARLVVFPDENHWILKPQASRLWHAEFFSWIEKYALGTSGTTGGTPASGANAPEAGTPKE